MSNENRKRKLVVICNRTVGTTIRRACMAQKPFRSEHCQGKSAWLLHLYNNHITTVCSACKALYMNAPDVVE